MPDGFGSSKLQHGRDTHYAMIILTSRLVLDYESDGTFSVPTEVQFKVIQTMLTDVGSLVMHCDAEFFCLQRSWCLAEIACAKSAGAEVLCYLRSIEDEVAQAMHIAAEDLSRAKCDSQAAENRSHDHKELIDTWIENHIGFQTLDNE